MKIQKYISFLLIGAFIPPFSGNAISSNSAQILDNFKTQQEKILFENIPFDDTKADDLLEKEYAMNGIVGLKSRLQTIQSAYETRKDEMTRKRLDLEEAVTIITDAINKTTYDIEDTQNKIIQKRKGIQEYRASSLDLRRKIQKNRQIILSYLSNIYTQGDLVYNKSTQSVDIFQTLILTDGDINSVTDDIAYKGLVSKVGQKFIDDYRAVVRQYYIIMSNIEKEVIELNELEKNLEIQKTNLGYQKSEREKLIEVTKGQEKLFEQYIESQKEAQRTLEMQWQTIQASYVISMRELLQKNGCDTNTGKSIDVERCANIMNFYEAEKRIRQNLASSGSLINPMNWPVIGRRISAFFHDKEYYQWTGSQHEAIDIPSPQGSPITSAMDGYVYFILPPTPGGYSYMAIKHPGGYVTVYGHLSEIVAKPYQFVKQGEIIAKSGGAPGTPGAGPMTSGAHLHFEVWYNKKPVDPLRVLNISTMDYKDIPNVYQDKFIDDFVARMGNTADTSGFTRRFVIKGDTEEQRQKYLLNTYAASDFKKLEIWVNTAVDAKIDPDFLMCVGLAETTLGNNLKTRYNVGNVGNTDSGDVVSFDSPQEAIQWMAKTFNNKYLGEYKYVSQLSRWGNNSGPIYASSNWDWHNNIIKCISAIKGTLVEDDYQFRIEPTKSIK